MPASKKDYKKKMERVISILARLDAKEQTNAIQLAEEYDVSVGTIYRDIKLLRFCEIPIEWDFQRKTLCIRGDYSLKKLELSPEEIQLIIMAKDFAGGMGVPFHEAADKLFEKVLYSGKCLSPMTHHYLKMDSSPVDKKRVTTSFKILEQAIKQNKCVWIRYQSIQDGAESERTISPYYFVWGYGDTFLRAWCNTNQGMRLFALDGVLEAKMTNEQFIVPSNINPEDEIKKGFGVFFGEVQDVVIRFQPEVAKLIKRKIWHPSQKLKENKDGSVTLSMQVSGHSALINWILSWGESAEVLKPKDLRQDISDLIGRLSEVYPNK